MTDWYLCVGCNEEWPAECFRASGNSYRYRRLCSACWLERYPRRRVECSGCGTAMETRGKGTPLCRACRRARSPIRRRRACGECGKPMDSRGTCPPVCAACRAQRRAESAWMCRAASIAWRAAQGEKVAA